MSLKFFFLDEILELQLQHNYLNFYAEQICHFKNALPRFRIICTYHLVKVFSNQEKNIISIFLAVNFHQFYVLFLLLLKFRSSVAVKNITQKNLFIIIVTTIFLSQGGKRWAHRVGCIVGCGHFLQFSYVRFGISNLSY